MRINMERFNWKKAFIYLLAIVYLLSPIDLIPDIPIFGLLDDVLVLIVAYVIAEWKKGDKHD